jgi:hypothetical protein
MRNILLTLFILNASWVNGQNILDYKFRGDEASKPLTEVLNEIGDSEGARFFFLPEWIEDIQVDNDYSGKTLEQVLNILFESKELRFILMYPDALVIIKDPSKAIMRKRAIETALREDSKIDKYRFGSPDQVQPDKTITISGRVIDIKTEEPLPYTNVQVADTEAVVTTDEQGNYKVELSAGSHVLNFSYIDYDPTVIDLTAYENGVVNVEMEKQSVVLDEIVIQGQANQEMATSRIGETQLVMKELKRAPAFLGEVDLIKQVQILPGVTTVGEAASGFNVRGGSVDQNLILYDGLPVFNSSHVFGFLSAFNSDAISEVSFFRGGTPAKYGGRISSVLDIQSKDGDFQEWHVKAGIGMVTSSLMVDGPLKKDETSISASLRSTYSNWLIHSIDTEYADLSNSSVSFYDGMIKVAHKVDKDTKVSVSGYASHDSFSLSGDSTYRWSNLQISGRLDHRFNSNLDGEFIIGMSSYGYSVLNNDYLTASELSFRINTATLKAALYTKKGSHKLNYGWQFSHNKFNPGSLEPTSDRSNAGKVDLDKQYAIESAFYIGDEIELNPYLFLEAGLRLPLFINLGPGEVIKYESGKPVEVTTATDTSSYGSFQPIKAFLGFEPRISMRLMTSANSSIKFGYNRMFQYLHLVSNSTAVTPVDIWQPSGYYFKPQRADQVSLGFFKDFKEKKYGTSVEGFYKYMNDIIDFKDGAELILNPHIETELLQGTGRSYGLEFSLFKNSGRLSGSLNYTYSRSFRTISGSTEVESINDGKEYPSNFDQPHILNVTWKYNLSRRYYFTGGFTYHTGRPITIPLSAFKLENTTVAYFSERNQYRIPDYHRLDLALVIEGNHKKTKKWKGNWVISVYNVYSRKNPYTIFFKNSENGVPKPNQLSIVGTIFPSISYNITF